MEIAKCVLFITAENMPALFWRFKRNETSTALIFSQRINRPEGISVCCLEGEKRNLL